MPDGCMPQQGQRGSVQEARIGSMKNTYALWFATLFLSWTPCTLPGAPGPLLWRCGMVFVCLIVIATIFFNRMQGEGS